MMTRKDYVSTAEILKGYALELGQGSFEELVSDFGEMFETDNPRFNFDKFREACNVN
jgi:hypothetical protein